MRRITNLLLITFVLLSCQACASSAGKPNLQKDVSPAFEQQTQVRGSLDKLIAAYQSKNVRAFMSQVSGDYTGDAGVLESAVRTDFSYFNNIGIRYTINNITPDAKGEAISMGVTFIRNYQVIKTGKIETVTGQTEIIFRKSAGNYLLYSMKKPVLFGLSE